MASEYSGFAIEIGEAMTHQDYDTFKQRVLAKQKLDLTKLSEGKVAFTDARGNVLELDHAGDFIRNGAVRDYGAPWSNWRPADGGNAPVRQDWMSGTLRVEVDGALFTCTVDDQGEVSFENLLNK